MSMVVSVSMRIYPQCDYVVYTPSGLNVTFGNPYRFWCNLIFKLVHVIGKPVTIAENVRILFTNGEEIFHVLRQSRRSILTTFGVILRTYSSTSRLVVPPYSLRSLFQRSAVQAQDMSPPSMSSATFSFVP